MPSRDPKRRPGGQGHLEETHPARIPRRLRLSLCRCWILNPRSKVAGPSKSSPVHRRSGSRCDPLTPVCALKTPNIDSSGTPLSRTRVRHTRSKSNTNILLPRYSVLFGGGGRLSDSPPGISGYHHVMAKICVLLVIICAGVGCSKHFYRHRPCC